MTHDEIAELIDKYHEYAKKLYDNDLITISNTKNVQILETGAFVEAVVWIPKEWLEK